MQISCAKCSTTYTLDERLLPPGGAPVQCTRCGHVFTAKPSAPRRQPMGTQLDGRAPGASVSPPSVASGELDPPDDLEPEYRTQVYGRLPALPPSAAEPARPPPAEPAAPRQAAPPARAPARATTQVFGAVAPPPAAPPARAPARATTQMFGAVASPPAAPPPGPSRTQTQVFGVPVVSPPVPPGAPSKAESTQVYGVLPRELLARHAGSPPPVAPAVPPVTATAGDEEPEWLGRTMPFGSTASPPPPELSPRRNPPQERHAPAAAGVPSVPAAHPEIERTQQFGAPDLAAIERMVADREAGGSLGTPAAAPAPSHAPAGMSSPQPRPIERPPRPSSGLVLPRSELPALPVPSTGAEARGEDDPSDLIREQIRRRNRSALLVLLLLALGAMGLFGYKLVVARLSQVSAEVQAAADAAIGLLRRDDAASRSRGIEQLEGLLKTNPEYIEAQAALTIALALELDDARLEIKRLEQQAELLDRRIARLQEEKTPGDWQNRVNAMIDELAALKKAMDPLAEEAARVDERLGETFRALPAQAMDAAPRDQQALARAQAVYFGVKGSDQAIALAERYRVLGGKDGWDSVALAEYALNTRVPPDTLSAARSAMDLLITRDSAFIRPYVLVARLYMSLKRSDLASSRLEVVAALNPEHEVAQKLLAWVNEAKRAESAEPR